MKYKGIDQNGFITENENQGCKRSLKLKCPGTDFVVFWRLHIYSFSWFKKNLDIRMVFTFFRLYHWISIKFSLHTTPSWTWHYLALVQKRLEKNTMKGSVEKWRATKGLYFKEKPSTVFSSYLFGATTKELKNPIRKLPN